MATPKFRTLRSRRYTRYIASGFLPFEAFELSGIRYSEAPYLRHMLKDRLRLRKAFDREADFNKWSRTRRDEEWVRVIKYEYTSHDWIRATQEWRVGRTRYKASPWEMLKFYRKQSIDEGEYVPKLRKAIRRDIEGRIMAIHISKGDVEAQRKRWHQKVMQSRGTPDYERYKRQRAGQKRRAKERKWAREH